MLLASVRFLNADCLDLPALFSVLFLRCAVYYLRFQVLNKSSKALRDLRLPMRGYKI